jgi:hypothetical protein
METLVGFAVGFFVGTREGRQGVTKLRETWAAIRESGDVKHLLGEATTALAPVMRELAQASGGGRS